MTLRRLPRGSSVLTLTFVVIFVCLFWSLPSGRPQPRRFGSAVAESAATNDAAQTNGPSGDGSEEGCPKEFVYLNRNSLRLSNNVIYSRRCIKPIWSTTVDRNEVVNVSRPLFQERRTIELPSCPTGAEISKCDDVSLRVPPPYPERTYSELVFGVSSYSRRLFESVDTFAHWLSGSKAKLLGVVSDDAGVTKETLRSLREAFSERGMDAEFIAPSIEGLSTSENHFAMIRDLVKRSNEKTKWIGILDDDTFFPSLYPLGEALAKYDHTKDQYLGALSEDFRAVRNWGYMAFGGAGVFLSVPAAKALADNIERCLEEATNSEGDGLLRDCVYHHTHAKLTQVEGLYQQDMMGDVSGFFEGGRRPISLHHWKSWYHHPVLKMSLISKLCGDCFLQRWRFGEDTLLTNGYSVTVYEGGLRDIELDRTEETWGERDGSYDFSLGPFRERMTKQQKKTYLLADTEVLPSAAIRQIYVYKPDRRSGEPDEVMELFWESDG